MANLDHSRHCSECSLFCGPYLKSRAPPKERGGGEIRLVGQLSRLKPLSMGSSDRGSITSRELTKRPLFSVRVAVHTAGADILRHGPDIAEICLRTFFALIQLNSDWCEVILAT